VLAGMPTVVYGFFAALTVAPFIRDTGGLLGLDVASESALAAGLVMGVMIIPFISSLSDDVMNAVPQALRDGAYALGATKLGDHPPGGAAGGAAGHRRRRAAGVSRAIGETMIVVMAAGLSANLTFNPLEAVTTVTVQIKTCWSAIRNSTAPRRSRPSPWACCCSSSRWRSTVVALRIVQKYREQYD
jgi:phosphate transport system permease protein